MEWLNCLWRCPDHGRSPIAPRRAIGGCSRETGIVVRSATAGVGEVAWAASHAFLFSINLSDRVSLDRRTWHRLFSVRMPPHSRDFPELHSTIDQGHSSKCAG
jgi:hypothetical protein